MADARAGTEIISATRGRPADLFLSYHHPDRESVLAVRRLLEARGLSTFLDRDNLTAGLPWPQALEEALREARAVAVFLGPAGLGTWQKREMWFALDRQAQEEREGRRFPVIPVLLARDQVLSGFLSANTALDLSQDPLDPVALDRLVRAARSEDGTATFSPSGSACPYQGLRPFREEDAAFFAGREAFSDRLLTQIGQRNLVAVVGPSGSGKSSVVQAGLLPRLRRQRPPAPSWDAVLFTPSSQPFHHLAAALLPLLEPTLSETDRIREGRKLGDFLASGEVRLEDVVTRLLEKSGGTDRLLLVADQFEELFTLAPEQVRVPFVEALLGALDRGPARLVLTLRADFYGRAIGLSRELSDRLEQGLVNLGPMCPDELRQAIEEPARRVGLQFAPGLVDTILDDVERQPGALPFLEVVLVELWRRREDQTLTLEAYRASGRVGGALAQRAEAVYTALAPREQAVTQRMLLALVQPGQQSEDTRRRLATSELLSQAAPGETATAERVLQTLVEARLLTVGGGQGEERWVEIAHEALIRGWERLGNWIEENREWLRVRNRLFEAASEWRRRDDPGALYRGARLEEALGFVQIHPEERHGDAAAFLAESQRQEDLRRRARYLGQAAGLAVGAGLGYATSFALGFWSRQVPFDPVATPLLVSVAFLTMLPVGQIVGFSIGLGLWQLRGSPLRRALLTGLVGALTSSLTYALFIAFFLRQPFTPAHLLAGALFGAGLGSGAAAPLGSRPRWLGPAVGGFAAVVLAGLTGGVEWNPIVLVVSGVLLGSLTGLGLHITAVDAAEHADAAPADVGV